MSRGVGERTRRAASAEGLPLALEAGVSARASLAGARANGGEQTRDARMQGKRGIGSIAGMVAAIAAMTLVRTFRWNELGLLDRVMIALLWIAVAAGVAAIGITLWRYLRIRLDAKRRTGPVGPEKKRSIY